MRGFFVLPEKLQLLLWVIRWNFLLFGSPPNGDNVSVCPVNCRIVEAGRNLQTLTAPKEVRIRCCLHVMQSAWCSSWLFIYKELFLISAVFRRVLFYLL